MNLLTALCTAARPTVTRTLDQTLERATALARQALTALEPWGEAPHIEPTPPAAANDDPVPTGRWIAGAVIPVADEAPADDCPLEEVLGAFDRLFDPQAPLTARRVGRWSLVPCSLESTAPSARVTARALEAEGARVLRLRRDGRDVALAGVHPLPASPSPLRRAS